jgi:hypothetical protein
LKNLNEYIEIDFEADLSEWLKKSNFEIFLLRNEESLKSIGFFLENQESFFPDFILWVKYKKKCFVAFIDPKWEADIFEWKNLKNKVLESINQCDNRSSETIIYNSFFINTSKNNKYFTGKGEFEENIFFPNEEKDYISRLFKDFIINELVNNKSKNLGIS